MASTDPDQTTPFYRASWLPVLPAALTVAGIILFGVLNLGYSLFYERLGVSPDAVGLNYANVLARSTILVALVVLAVVVLCWRYLVLSGYESLLRNVENLDQNIERAQRAADQALSQLAQAEAGLAGRDEVDELARDAAREVQRNDSRSIALDAARRVAREEALSRARRVARDAANVPRSTVQDRRNEVLEALQRAPATAPLNQALEESRALLSSSKASVVTGRGSGRAWRYASIRARTILIAAAMSLVLIATVSLVAVQRANAARAGDSVRPVRVLGLTVLDISAQPAALQPSGVPGEHPAIAALQDRRLLYLGQSAGTIVLFDSENDRAVLLPAADAVLQLRD